MDSADEIKVLFGDKPFAIIGQQNGYNTSLHRCSICGAIVCCDDREKHIRFHKRLGFTFVPGGAKEFYGDHNNADSQGRF
jgi:hypothetical protein